MNGEINHIPLSQKQFPIHFYSRRINGDQVESLFSNDYFHSLFVYSKNCHGCKKFLPIYEELAKENLS